MKLGDLIESITKAIGIKPCAGCKKRKAWLNRLGDRWFKPKSMTCAERNARHIAHLKQLESKGQAKFENGQWFVKKLITHQ